MTTIIIAVVALFGAVCGLLLYACCKIAASYDRVKEAIDADFEAVPPSESWDLFV